MESDHIYTFKSLKITMTYQNLPQTDIARKHTAEFTDSFRM